MDKRRQGEIALKIVKQLTRKRGMKIMRNAREFEILANAIEVSVEELKQFAKFIVQELIEDSFSAK